MPIQFKRPLSAAAFAFLLAGLPLAAGLAADGKAGALPDKAALESAIHDYIVSHPEVVIEALEKYQSQQRQREEEKAQNALKDNKAAIYSNDSPTAGNPSGDVTVVEFFDYNCGYCKRALDDVKTLIGKDSRVKFIFKDLPILSESSHDAARWALAAKNQGKYWEYHQALMAFPGGKSPETLEKLAKDAGLDVGKLKKDADSKEVREELESNAKLARELGISGTPAFIIDDMLAPGYMGYDNLKQAVENARKDKKG